MSVSRERVPARRRRGYEYRVGRARASVTRASPARPARAWARAAHRLYLDLYVEYCSARAASAYPEYEPASGQLSEPRYATYVRTYLDATTHAGACVAVVVDLDTCLVDRTSEVTRAVSPLLA